MDGVSLVVPGRTSGTTPGAAGTEDRVQPVWVGRLAAASRSCGSPGIGTSPAGLDGDTIPDGRESPAKFFELLLNAMRDHRAPLGQLGKPTAQVSDRNPRALTLPGDQVRVDLDAKHHVFILAEAATLRRCHYDGQPGAGPWISPEGPALRRRSGGAASHQPGDQGHLSDGVRGRVFWDRRDVRCRASRTGRSQGTARIPRRRSHARHRCC